MALAALMAATPPHGSFDQPRLAAPVQIAAELILIPLALHSAHDTAVHHENADVGGFGFLR